VLTGEVSPLRRGYSLVTVEHKANMFVGRSKENERSRLGNTLRNTAQILLLPSNSLPHLHMLHYRDKSSTNWFYYDLVTSTLPRNIDVVGMF
jgi:hypothetical protein